MKKIIIDDLPSIIDPFVIISPLTLCRKILYREANDLKFSSEKPIKNELSKKWKKWASQNPQRIEFPRSIKSFQETIQAIDSNAFADASKDGV